MLVARKLRTQFLAQPAHQTIDKNACQITQINSMHVALGLRPNQLGTLS